MTDGQPDLGQLILMLGDPSTREAVPSKLHQYGESAIEPLMAALQGGDEQVRQGVAWVVGRMTNSVLGLALAPAAHEPLIQALQTDSSGRVRLQALKALVVLTDSENRSELIAPLTASLQDEVEQIRLEAARWLGQNGAAEALDTLRAVLETDASEKVRGRAAYALAYIEPNLQTLADVGAAGIDALMTATKDNERSVRLRAIWALGQLKSTLAVRTLTDIVEHGSDVPEKRKSAEALGEIGDGAAVDVLIIALQFDPHESVRGSAAEALGVLHDGRALNSLIRALHSDAIPSVRASAAKALEMMGDPAAVEPLIQALADHNPDVCFRTAAALGTLGDERAVEPLNVILHNANSSRHVRVAAQQALDEIDRQRQDA